MTPFRKNKTVPARRALCAMLLLCAVLALPASAQETINSMREAASKYFSAGEFADALPYLEQLIEIQGSSKDPHVISTLEKVYWNAAMCKFFVGDFSGAKASFERYNGKYKHGLYIHESYVYIGDCLRYSNKPKDAITQYKVALKTFKYPPDTRTDIHASIARCYLAQDDWPSAVEPLRQALATAPA